MEGESPSNDLQSLLQAIKSSDIVESRIQLLTQLGESGLIEKSELATLVECLATLWEDFTCLDISQCLLNKTILHVAAKYLGSDESRCSEHFLALGTKASIWSAKHLKMTLISTDDSQEEEHSNILFQLILDLLSFSAACLSALAISPVLREKVSMVIVEKFLFEQLSLIKDLISEIKRIHSTVTEILKVGQVVIDAAIKLCREYSKALSGDSFNVKGVTNKVSIENEAADDVNHVLSIAKCTIENLYALGITAASGGGGLVTILNVSWKGVVVLLQLYKGFLAIKVNVADIILTLVSLATESLRCASEAWSSTPKETIGTTEARRTFLPVKFYLINAVRISSQFPCQAFTVHREMTLCLLMISTFGTALSKEIHLKAASEVLVELLEPTAFLLLNTLLNSAEVKQDSKFQILDWLFIDESYSNYEHGEEASLYPTTSLTEIFAVNCKDTPGARILILGRIAVFLNLLQSSPDLREDTILGISRKLGWILDMLIDGEVYSSSLVLNVPRLHGSGSPPELVWGPIYRTILHALKTFMIVASSTSTLAWGEVEAFLLENLFHPHFLCWDIIMELWCFFVRHVEKDIVNNIMEKLCSLLKFLASSESAFIPDCPLRRMARSICMLLSNGAQSTIDQVYNSVVNGNRSQLSSVMYVVLLMEGFPLNLLSDNMKKIVTQKIITTYHGFMEKIDNLRVDSLSRSCGSVVSGEPVYALSSAFCCLQIRASDIDLKTLKFVGAIVHGYRSAIDDLMKDHYCKLLGEILRIISNMKHLYETDEMEEVILELHSFFIVGCSIQDTRLYQCKPALASFMAGLCHIEMTECDGNAKSSAVWKLYHMLLREKHWASVHLAISAFGHFAARTSCNQLWRFVPHDATLSFNIESGNEANEERFMSELKAFLEKKVALLTVTTSAVQLGLLVKEGLMLQKAAEEIIKINREALKCEITEVDDLSHPNKRRKFPDGITEGLALLQNGLKVVGDNLVLWRQQPYDATELQDKFSTHVSHLEDVIAHLVGLTGTG